MSPGNILLLAAVIGVLLLAIFLFPTIETAVTDWVTNVMPSHEFTDLEQFLIKMLPYAGLGLFCLFGFWIWSGNKNQ